MKVSSLMQEKQLQEKPQLNETLVLDFQPPDHKKYTFIA
jgi:hypothetical protein